MLNFFTLDHSPIFLGKWSEAEGRAKPQNPVELLENPVELLENPVEFPKNPQFRSACSISRLSEAPYFLKDEPWWPTFTLIKLKTCQKPVPSFFLHLKRIELMIIFCNIMQFFAMFFSG